MNKYLLPKVIAHRGACGYAPENTMVSFRKAYELGAKWVEFDVVLSKDGVPVVFHDATTTRTTNLPEHNIAELTLNEIKQLDAGSWFAAEFKGEQVPTLEEVLVFLRQHDMQANIEIKPTPYQESATARAVLTIVKKHYPAPRLQELPLISSFAAESLTTIRYVAPDYPLALLRNPWEAPDVILLTSLRCVSAHIYYGALTAEIVNNIKQLGCDIMSFTVNDLAVAQQLFSWGVDGIFTNYYDRFTGV